MDDDEQDSGFNVNVDFRLNVSFLRNDGVEHEVDEHDDDEEDDEEEESLSTSSPTDDDEDDDMYVGILSRDEYTSVPVKTEEM